MSLLRDSEDHRNALIKLLKTSFVPQEISVNQFEHVVASITASNGLGFTDFDFPQRGKKAQQSSSYFFGMYRCDFVPCAS